jgi:uncharacterized protein (TIGR02300 family)
MRGGTPGGWGCFGAHAFGLENIAQKFPGATPMTPRASTAEIKAQRGTKRTCQNPECESRFYDLHRDPITCPMCGTVYALPHAAPEATPAAQKPHRAPPRTPAPAPRPEDAPEVEGDELVAAEGEDEAVAEEDDALIEEVEEDPSDVSAIVDAPIEKGDEK